MNVFSALRGPSLGEVLNLLNETILLASRTRVWGRFRGPLNALRTELQKAAGKQAVVKEVYANLTGVRREMRLAGYDLSMGKYRLIFDGFRNDDVLGSGFRRAVLFMGEKSFYWRTGDDNHIVLSEELDEALMRAQTRDQIFGKHYLWVGKTKTAVTLSGSATESAENYEELKAAGSADSLLFLSKIKGLI